MLTTSSERGAKLRSVLLEFRVPFYQSEKRRRRKGRRILTRMANKIPHGINCKCLSVRIRVKTKPTFLTFLKFSISEGRPRAGEAPCY
ncbi:hypothetical protein NPIL_460151 [Nephila pilipes]|uniref:Uncharacterized protein n=1 Tax=Nephila pilipes TaxID=299642 RepID=A0A8X6UHQ2_NEPPI|nr:hypothetical protein NPIL_460151 [Nephila pilipes]